MSRFDLHNVSFSCADRVLALGGVSLTVGEGERLALAADARGPHAPDREALAADAAGVDL